MQGYDRQGAFKRSPSDVQVASDRSDEVHGAQGGIHPEGIQGLLERGELTLQQGRRHKMSAALQKSFADKIWIGYEIDQPNLRINHEMALIGPLQG